MNGAMKSLYCVEILNAIGLKNYLKECYKNTYYCSYSDKQKTCSRLFDVKNDVVIGLYDKYVVNKEIYNDEG